MRDTQVNDLDKRIINALKKAANAFRTKEKKQTKNGYFGKWEN